MEEIESKNVKRVPVSEGELIIPEDFQNKEAFWNGIQQLINSKHEESLQKKKKLLMSWKEYERKQLLHKWNLKTSMLQNLQQENLQLKRLKMEEQLEYDIRKNEIMKLKQKISEITAENEDRRNQLLISRGKKKELEEDISATNKRTKEIHQAFLTAMNYYKQHLPCHIELEDDMDCFTFTFFISKPSLTVQNYSVKLRQENDTWELLETHPSLRCEEKLRSRLKETGDILGFITHVRELFKQLMDQ